MEKFQHKSAQKSESNNILIVKIVKNAVASGALRQALSTGQYLFTSTCWLVLVLLSNSVLSNLKSHIIIHPWGTNDDAPSNL